MSEPTPAAHCPSITRADWLLIALLVALVLPLRVWLLCNTEVTARDGIGYIRYSLHFEQDTWSGVLNKNHQHPGYPLLVWVVSQPVRAFAGETTPDNMALSAQLVNLIASLILIVPMYLLGRQFFGQSISFGAVLIHQHLPISAQNLSDGISEPIFLVFLVSGLLHAVHAVRRPTLARGACCGLFAALAYLTRPEGALLLVAFGIGLIALQLRPAWRVGGRPFLQCGAGALATALLVGSVYFVATGKFTNKPAVRVVMHQDEISAAVTGDGSHLFAASFPHSEQGVRRVVRSVATLLAELAQGLYYVGIAPALLGFLWTFRSFRGDAGYWMIIGFAALHSCVLFRLAYMVSYLSERHVMILTLISCYFAAAGLCELPRRLMAWRGIEKARWATGLAVILFAGVIALSLPRATQRLHGDRAGNHAAGVWLHDQLGPGDVVWDDHSWSHYFAGLVLLEGNEPAIPADRQPKCYVVVTRSRDPHIDQQRQAAGLEPDARVAYRWPENVPLERARVIVHVQARSQKVNPFRVTGMPRE